MTKIIRGIMLDTETLALATNALVWEMAYMPFAYSISDDNKFMGLEKGFGRRFLLNYSGIDTSIFRADDTTIYLTNKTRGEDEDWINWRNVYQNVAGATLGGTVGPAQIWANLFSITTEDTEIWCRNAAFDFPILENLFKSAGLKTTWHRSQQNDIYTIVNQAKNFGNGYAPPTRPEGEWHHALHDVEWQIDDLAVALQSLHA